MSGYCNKVVLWASVNLVLVFLYFYLLRGDVQLIKGYSDPATITSHSTTKHGLIRSGENCNDKDTTTTKPHITLAIAIGSKAEYPDRRNLIRNSWMQWATNSSSVIIKFFSDQPSTENRTAVETELQTYQDTILSPSTLGAYWRSMARTLHQMDGSWNVTSLTTFCAWLTTAFYACPVCCMTYKITTLLQTASFEPSTFVCPTRFCPTKISF